MHCDGLLHIDYMRCLRCIGRNKAAIAVFAALCGFVGVLTALIVMDTGDGFGDMYEAISSVYSRAGKSYGQESDAASYAEIAKSLRVAEAAERLLGDSAPDRYKIQDMTEVYYDETVSFPQSPTVMYICVRSIEPSLAAGVSNAVARAFVDEMLEIDGDSTIHILDNAYSCKRVYTAWGRLGVCAAAGVAAGIVLACGFIVLSEILSPRLYEVEDAKLYGELEILGVIPQCKPDSH